MAKTTLNYTTSTGWHLCNDKYRISRIAGCDTYIVFISVQGNGYMKVNDTLYKLPENTVGIIPRDTAHEYYVPKNKEWEFYWIHLNGISASAILDHMIASHGYVLPACASCRELCSGIEEILFMKNTGKPNFELCASQVITNMLHGLLIRLQEHSRHNMKGNMLVMELLRSIESNYGTKLSIQSISKSLYVNPIYLARLFKATTGFTPYEYLMRYRIMISKELLQYTEMSIKEIAQLTGFSHASNFINQFKALESVTPGKHRKAGERT